MWWLIIPIAVFIIILCIVLDGERERQDEQSARMPIDDSWLFDNDGETYREFEFETSDEKTIINGIMTDKNFKKGDIIRITESGDMICDHKIDPKKHLWVVDEECKSRPHGNPIYGIFTLDRANNLHESAAFPYAMELVEFPTSEEQELGWHIKAAVDKSREKIKLEDMTIKQIRELKEDLKKRIANVLNKFNDETGLYPTIKVTYDVTEIPLYMESYGGNITACSEECERIYERVIDINFNTKI